MNNAPVISRFGVATVVAGLSVAILGVFLGPAQPMQAALIEAGKGPQLLVGAFADLSLPSPAFVAVSHSEAQTLNPLVAAMIR